MEKAQAKNIMHPSMYLRFAISCLLNCLSDIVSLFVGLLMLYQEQGGWRFLGSFCWLCPLAYLILGISFAYKIYRQIAQKIERLLFARHKEPSVYAQLQHAVRGLLRVCFPLGMYQNGKP